MQIRLMKLEDIEQVVILENKQGIHLTRQLRYLLQIRIKSSKILKMEHIILLLKKIKTF